MLSSIHTHNTYLRGTIWSVCLRSLCQVFILWKRKEKLKFCMEERESEHEGWRAIRLMGDVRAERSFSADPGLVMLRAERDQTR